jgi:hypothetical protein
MISTETITALEARGLRYILGVRERTDKPVRDVVLNDAAPFVPLFVDKRGRDIEYAPRRLRWAGRAILSASTTSRRRKTPPSQMAEVMVPRDLFQQFLTAIAALRPLPPARC